MGKLKVYYYNVNRLISYWAALVFNPLLAAASFNVATTDHLTLSLQPPLLHDLLHCVSPIPPHHACPNHLSHASLTCYSEQSPHSSAEAAVFHLLCANMPH